MREQLVPNDLGFVYHEHIIQKLNCNYSNTKIMTIASINYLLLLVGRFWSEDLGIISQKGFMMAYILVLS